jgi:chromosome segregation ATPase
MSEFSFPEVAEETRHEHQPEAAASEPGTLALSADEFSALEERILRAVNLVKRERLAKAAAEERATAAEAKIAEHIQASVQAAENLNRERDELQKETASLQKEIDALRAERDQVRQRVERLLSQLDALEA